MEPHRSSSKPNLHKLLRTFAKLLRFRAAQKKLCKLKFHEKGSEAKTASSVFGVPKNQVFNDGVERVWEERYLGVVLAKAFACISTIKASYARLQLAQTPYVPEEVQVADEMVVSELKELSELKHGYLKKQMDESVCSLQESVLVAEAKELKSVVKSYEIMGKKLEPQIMLKDSEILFLREKLEESDKENELLEKELDPFGFISSFENLQFSELNAKHFVILLRYSIESVGSFVKLFVSQMSCAGWDLDAAAEAIQPGVVFHNVNDVPFAFESYVCQEMFDGFQYMKFSVHGSQRPRRVGQERRCFDKFMELKSTNAMEMLKLDPECGFGRFCRLKYLGLIHPKMELAFFGDLDQRNVIDSGCFPETAFFTAFVEMAKCVWLLHRLAFSFDPEVTIFQVRKGVQYSEVFMENVVEDTIDSPPIIDPIVGFTVIPGFKIGKTVIQSQVYLSPT